MDFLTVFLWWLEGEQEEGKDLILPLHANCRMIITPQAKLAGSRTFPQVVIAAAREEASPITEEEKIYQAAGLDAVSLSLSLTHSPFSSV